MIQVFFLQSVTTSQCQTVCDRSGFQDINAAAHACLMIQMWFAAVCACYCCWSPGLNAGGRSATLCVVQHEGGRAPCLTSAKTQKPPVSFQAYCFVCISAESDQTLTAVLCCYATAVSALLPRRSPLLLHLLRQLKFILVSECIVDDVAML